MEMNMTENFFRILYENVADGSLSVTYLTGADPPITKWFTTSQLEEMAAFAGKCGKKHNTYVNVNPRVKPLDSYHRGASGDVSTVIGLYQDYDIRGAAHVETRLPETAEQLYDFADAALPEPSLTVYSGNGVHNYWLFHKPYRIRSEEDRAYIAGISQEASQNLCKPIKRV